MPAVDDQGDVDIDDVALAHRLVVGNAVADDVVDGGADRLAVAAIVERGGIGAMVHRELEGEIVKALGRDAGLHLGREHVERERGQAAGLAHGGEIFRAVQFDLACLAAGSGCGVDEIHVGR